MSSYTVHLAIEVEAPSPQTAAAHIAQKIAAAARMADIPTLGDLRVEFVTNEKGEEAWTATP